MRQRKLSLFQGERLKTEWEFLTFSSPRKLPLAQQLNGARERERECAESRYADFAQPPVADERSASLTSEPAHYSKDFNNRQQASGRAGERDRLLACTRTLCCGITNISHRNYPQANAMPLSVGLLFVVIQSAVLANRLPLFNGAAFSFSQQTYVS